MSSGDAVDGGAAGLFHPGADHVAPRSNDGRQFNRWRFHAISVMLEHNW
jgi:hypothetical protein